MLLLFFSFCLIEFFSSFLDEEFDVKAHANKAIQGVAITEQLAKLADGMALLDKEIHNQVIKCFTSTYKTVFGHFEKFFKCMFI